MELFLSVFMWLTITFGSSLGKHPLRGISHCPTGCQCKDLGIISGVQVNCVHLKEVPKEWPRRVKHISLHLSGHPKADIEPGSFANLTAVRSIEIKGNIGDIRPEAFFNLTGIKSVKYDTMSEIIIWSASIERIQTAAFRKIRNFNFKVTMSSIHSIEAGAFSDVSNMAKFDISNSKITNIKEEAFTGVHHVRQVSLRFTKIEVLYNFAFSGLYSIQEFMTLDINVTVCMGRYSFSGIKAKAVNFVKSRFLIEPHLANPAEGGGDTLKCANGWDIPDTSVWFYRQRINISLILAMTITGLVVCGCVMCCVFCPCSDRRTMRDRRCGCGSCQAQAFEDHRSCLFRGWLCRYIQHQRESRTHHHHHRHGRDNRPPEYDQEIQTITLPSYADCLKMAPAYTPMPTPQTPPPEYYVYSVADLFTVSQTQRDSVNEVQVHRGERTRAGEGASDNRPSNTRTAVETHVTDDTDVVL